MGGVFGAAAVIFTGTPAGKPDQFAFRGGGNPLIINSQGAWFNILG